jgi:hypothetical protein
VVSYARCSGERESLERGLAAQSWFVSASGGQGHGKTLVDTSPIRIVFNRNSPEVSMMILGPKGASALSLATLRQRS